MATIPQSQLVILANQMCSLMQGWRSDLQTAQDLLTQYQSLQGGTAFAAMPTAPTNPDGTLGVADTAPVTSHVIDNRVVATLTVAISSYDLGVVNSILQAFVNLFEGTAVTTQTYAPAMLAATASESFPPG